MLDLSREVAVIDADEPHIGADICRAGDEGRTVVLVSPDGTVRTLVARG